MLKFLVSSTLLLLGWINGLCQTTDDLQLQGPMLYSVYLSGDTSTIKDHWKLEKGEVLGIQKMLEIQEDVFGKLEYPKTYRFKEWPFAYKKYTMTTLKLDSISPVDWSAQVDFDIFKRKKRKSQFQIQEVKISSQSQLLKGFSDSLCSPYLKMILANQSDSLAEIVFQTKELKQSLNEFKKNASKKEREKAEGAYGFMSLAFEIVQNGLNSIDTSSAPTFEKCFLHLKTGDPELKITYLFKGKNDEDIKCTMSFQLEGKLYHLSGLGVSNGSRRAF